MDVLLFPELSLTGYDLRQNATEIAIEFDDKILIDIARESKDMKTVVGFVELGFAAQIHNTAAALKNGESFFIHRKLNLPNYGRLEEGKVFSSGRYIETFPLRHPWYTSILICSDVWNPALVHLVAVRGSTVLLVPTNSADLTVSSDFSNPEGWDLTLRFYSMMYGMPIVMANRIGQEGDYKFWGLSKIVGPKGEIIKEAGQEEELIVADLDYKDVVRARAQLPTVRDSNLDLIQREIERLRDKIGYPKILRHD